MTSKYLLSAALVLALPALSGCAGLESLDKWDPLGFEQRPAEQSNGRAAPLVVPPDAALAPVQNGAPRPQDATTEQTMEALFGGAAQRSSTEGAIIRSAGTSEIGIRSVVGDPNTLTVNKGSVTRDIISAPEGDGQNAQAVVGG